MIKKIGKAAKLYKKNSNYKNKKAVFRKIPLLMYKILVLLFKVVLLPYLHQLDIKYEG